ncbi:MAG: hypothetical protein AAGB16_06855 [Pseudomonadota bacterium]
MIGKVMVALSAAKFVKGIAKGFKSFIPLIAGQAANKRFRVAAIMLLRYGKAWKALALLGRSLFRTVFSPLVGGFVLLQAGFAAWNKENSKLKALWEKLVEIWQGRNGGIGLGKVFEFLANVVGGTVTMAFNGLVAAMNSVAGALLFVIEKLEQAYALGKKTVALVIQTPAGRNLIAPAVALASGYQSTTGTMDQRIAEYIGSTAGTVNNNQINNTFQVTPEAAVAVANEMFKIGDYPSSQGMRRIAPVGG